MASLSSYAPLQSLHQVNDLGLLFLWSRYFFALLPGVDRLLDLLAIAILVLAEIEFALVPFSDQLSGIPVLKTEAQLRDAVKEALDRLQSKGIYDQLLAKYGLQGSKTPAGVNQGK